MRARSLLGFAALALLLGGGCNTYHYFDVTIVFDSTLPEEQVGYLQLCNVAVSGADSDSLMIPTNADKKSYCPVTDFHSFPTLGTFEYSTFSDSGEIKFSFNGYDFLPAMPNYLCATGSVSFTAGAAITQSKTLNVTAGPNTCMSQTQM